MTSRPKGPPLVVLYQDEMTVKSIETILSQTDFSGYPIVVSMDSQRLFGYITRRDLQTAFGRARTFTTPLLSWLARLTLFWSV